MDANLVRFALVSPAMAFRVLYSDWATVHCRLETIRVSHGGPQWPMDWVGLCRVGLVLLGLYNIMLDWIGLDPGPRPTPRFSPRP
eukprot:5208370-Lingulodinium_polyedra.AAC.1